MAIHKDDIGTELIVTLSIDVTLAAAGFPKVRLKKPSAVFLQRAGSDQISLTVTDTTNGVGKITFVSGELNESGTWTGETKLTFQDGTAYTGDSFTFSVGTNLS